MRTSITIDDTLMAEAMKVTGFSTKREVMEEALKLLVRWNSRMDLRELQGKIQFADGYDYKALREGRFDGNFARCKE